MTEPARPHLDEDAAIAFVHDLLSESVREEIRAHADACAECDALLLRTAAERERFRARYAGLGGRSRRTRRAALAGAGVAIAAALAIVFLGRGGSRDTPAAGGADGLLRLPSTVEIVRFRNLDSAADLRTLERALEDYARGDDAAVIGRLTARLSTPRLDGLRRAYLASALLAVERTDEARAQLDTLAHTPLGDEYVDWVAWARFRAADDAARADSVVKAIAERPGPLQAEARRVLR